MAATETASDSFLVVCLCADWCGTCRDYRQGFMAMAADFPGAQFRWIDVEDQSDLLGDRDIENFPTLHIQRGQDVLFFGVMPPQHAHLRRTLEVFYAQSPEESRQYAVGTDERRQWQVFADLREALANEP